MQPQLGATISLPQEGAALQHDGAQQARRAANRARRFCRMFGRQADAQGSQQLAVSQPQLGATVSHPQLGAAEQQDGAASQQLGAQQVLNRLRIRLSNPIRDPHPESQQDISHPQEGAISHPQVGAASQGSQPQPRLNKPALAEELAKLIATRLSRAEATKRIDRVSRKMELQVKPIRS